MKRLHPLFLRLLLLTPIGFALYSDIASADFGVERVLSGLTQPMSVTQAPGNNRVLYVVERTNGGSGLGRILAYDQLTKSTTTFLDLTGNTVSDGGLLSMTFHPEHQTNGLFYTVSNEGRVNGLDEWRVVAGQPQLQRRIFEYENLQNVFHTLNQAQFRPGGASNEIFVTSGDGGTQANSPAFDSTLIEDPNSPFGKLLRFDLNADFSTPAGGAAHPGVDTVALGLRNPYRSAFDRQTGDLYIADVGFMAVEEVDYIPSSHFDNAAAPVLDFGWTDREGTIETIANNAGGPGSPGDISPIFEYAHNGGVPLPHPTALTGGSITGGYVYRGAVEELQGRYFFADFTSQVIYSGEFDTSTPAASYNGDNLTDLQRHDIDFENQIEGGAALQYLTSFGEDNSGNLYIVKFGDSFFPPAGQGEVFRIVPSHDASLTAEVNRDDGSITLSNSSGAPVAFQAIALSTANGAIAIEQLATISGHYDSAGDGSVDDEPWALETLTNYLYTDQTTGDSGELAGSASLVLAETGGWLPSPTEDIALAVLLDDGSVLDVPVTFTGNNDMPFGFGDLTFDGLLNRTDFYALAAFAHTNLDGLSPAEAYARGDLNGDGFNNFTDFYLLKQQYVSQFGEDAFSRLFEAPEPSSIAGILSAVACLVFRRRGVGG